MKFTIRDKLLGYLILLGYISLFLAGMRAIAIINAISEKGYMPNKVEGIFISTFIFLFMLMHIIGPAVDKSSNFRQDFKYESRQKKVLTVLCYAFLVLFLVIMYTSLVIRIVKY